MKRVMIFLGLLFISYQLSANIIVNGTRVIYYESNKDVAVQLTNTGDASALVQAWLDDGDINSTPENANVPFLLSPPVSKINPLSGQQLRIKKLPYAFAADRESLYYLNILDIPATAADKKGKNTLQLALKTRLKFFYRPNALAKLSTEAIYQQVTYQRVGQQITIKNSSPFYFTVAAITPQNKKQPNYIEPVMVAPFAQSTVTTKTSMGNQQLQVIYVDDYGDFIGKPITLQ